VASTAQRRRPGSVVRSVNQARATPSTAQIGSVSTTNSRVFNSSSATRGRKTRALTVCQPVSNATPITNPSGNSASSDSSTALATTIAPGR